MAYTIHSLLEEYDMKLVVVKVWVDTDDENDAVSSVKETMAIGMEAEIIKDYAIDSVEDAQ